MQKKEYYLYLDLLRLIACLMVVVMHSMRGGENANGVVYSALSTFAKPCNALFFMTSGALLLPVDGDELSFLKRRLGKIVVPCILWTIIYNLLQVLYGEESIQEAICKLGNIPFSSKGYGILWFVYVLIGLYFVAPILSPWLKVASKRSVEYVIGLWFITLVLLVVRNFVYVPDNEEQMFYYFGGYAGYFLLGYYLHHYKPIISSWFLIIFVLLPFVLSLLYHMESWADINRASLASYLSFPTALASFAYFSLFQKFHNNSRLNNLSRKLSIRGKQIIPIISKLTFGVYLIHIPVRNVIWRFSNITSYGVIEELSLTIVSVFFFSLILVYMISFIPFSNYLIGYQNK